MTVTLVEEVPEAQGRQWTADDYATRDAALASLGISYRRFRRTNATDSVTNDPGSTDENC